MFETDNTSGASAQNHPTTYLNGTAQVAPSPERNTAMNKTTTYKLALLASAIALITVPARATPKLVFDVYINTAGLSSELPDAPFFLDFQLLYGNSSLASNTATLSNFDFSGGTPTGSPVLIGSATGNLSSTVTLAASSSTTDSEFYQPFQTGVSAISFQATVTEAGPDIGTPTEFTASILDSSLGFPAQLFTTAPDTESLVVLDLSSANTLGDVQTFKAVSSADGNTPLVGVGVPDGGATAALVGCAALALACFGRRLGLQRNQPLGTATSA
jgi:hypothetical protein